MPSCISLTYLNLFFFFQYNSESFSACLLTDTHLFLYLTLPPLFLESIIVSAAITSSSAGILAPEVRWLDYTIPLLLDWAQLLQVVLCKLIIKILRRMGSDWNPVGSPGLLPFEGYQWGYQSKLLFQTPFWNNSILVTNSSYASECTLWKEGLTSSLWAQILPHLCRFRWHHWNEKL